MNKRSALFAIAGLLIGVAAYACVYLAATSRERHAASSPAPALAWLRDEFRLDDAQFQKLNELHEGYLPKCAEMCRRIDAKNAELERMVRESGSVTPEVQALLAEAARLRAECHSNMLEHFFAVSRAMPPEQGERYLEWIIGATFGGPSTMAGGHANHHDRAEQSVHGGHGRHHMP